jgi:hypothetical protein
MEEKLIYDPVRVEVIELSLPTSILNNSPGAEMGDNPNEEDNG